MGGVAVALVLMSQAGILIIMALRWAARRATPSHEEPETHGDRAMREHRSLYGDDDASGH